MGNAPSPAVAVLLRLPPRPASGIVLRPAMNIHEATTKYERWLGRQLTLLPADLARKHRRMAEDA